MFSWNDGKRARATGHGGMLIAGALAWSIGLCCLVGCQVDDGGSSTAMETDDEPAVTDTFSGERRAWPLGTSAAVYSHLEPRRSVQQKVFFGSVASKMARRPESISDEYIDLTIDEIIASLFERSTITIYDVVYTGPQGPYLIEGDPRISVTGVVADSESGISVEVNVEMEIAIIGRDTAGIGRSKLVEASMEFRISFDRTIWLTPAGSDFHFVIDVAETIRAEEGEKTDSILLE